MRFEAFRGITISSSILELQLTIYRNHDLV